MKTAATSADKPQTAKEVIAANAETAIERLQAGHSEGLTGYLTAMGRFHQYGLGNVLEIARQRPRRDPRRRLPRLEPAWPAREERRARHPHSLLTPAELHPQARIQIDFNQAIALALGLSYGGRIALLGGQGGRKNLPPCFTSSRTKCCTKPRAAPAPPEQHAKRRPKPSPLSRSAGQSTVSNLEHGAGMSADMYADMSFIFRWLCLDDGSSIWDYLDMAGQSITSPPTQRGTSMQIVSESFDWSTIRQHLVPGLRIPSHSNPNRTFEIDRVDSDKISVWPMKSGPRPEQRSRAVPRADFETVVQHWNDYHSAAGFAIPTWNNSYCLAIIAYVLEQIEGSRHPKGQA